MNDNNTKCINNRASISNPMNNNHQSGNLNLDINSILKGK